MNVVVSSHSVNASLRKYKPVYAKAEDTSQWYRIDRYRLVDKGRSTVHAMARTLSANARWFRVDGQNVEVRP